MTENIVLVSGAIVFKKTNAGIRWFLAKTDEDSDWEIPKGSVRKGESSVRTSIRIMQEMGGMDAKVLEEAGRAGGSTTVNGKVVSQRYLFYLLQMLDKGEPIGFAKHAWLEYAKAVRKLATKRDQTMLRSANKVLKEVMKEEGRVE